MSKRNIRFIILLMSLALVGLVSFQMYWIKLAVEVKNDRFNQSVREAMESVVKSLEKQEILFLASQKIMRSSKEESDTPIIPSPPIAQKSSKKRQYTASAQQPRRYAKVNSSKKHKQKQKQEDSQRWADVTVVHPGFQSFDQSFPFHDAFFHGEDMLLGTDPLLWGQNWQDVPLLSGEGLYTDGLGEDYYLVEPAKVPTPSRPTSHKNLINKRFRLDSLQRMVRNQQRRDTAWSGSTMRHFSFDHLPMAERERLKRPAQYNDSLVQAINQRWYQLEKSQDSVIRAFMLEEPTMAIRRPPLEPKPREKKLESFDIDQFYANLDTVEAIKTSFKEKFDKPEQKVEVMQDVFNALITTNRSIEERINSRMLDSLLKKEIRNRGIEIPFEYGVHGKAENQVMFASLDGKKDDLLQSAFKVSLFPNDVYCAENYLVVNFPNQQQYIFQKLGVVFLSSVVLILVVVACFYIAITTILKQKKLSDVKNDFINNMTHEFKTPIATISLACEVLQEGSIHTDQSKVHRYLNVIQDENKRLGTQVEKVLQTALLDKGKINLKFTKVDLHEVIDHVLQNIGLQIEQRDGTIELDLRADYPVVEADEVHVTNIVHNLVDNANKYSPENPQIGIETRNMKGGIYITITDKGIGMTKEAVSRVFERFYRVPTGNVHNVKGFGLGLSYVKTMVQIHRGTITVESQPDKGSAFEVFLPYSQS